MPRNEKISDLIDYFCSGKRVAFSCFGSVTSLSGEAESGVIIEAMGTGDSCKNQQEEAISEANGQFRIRGLQPKVKSTKNV
jgi:hypothetical protein